MAADILLFMLCAGLVVASGIRLTFHGDRIAELTGIGKAWVGLVLMAAVTSLPELVTGFSSVVFIDQPDLAAGDLFGSCVYNLLILSLIDARVQHPITSLVKPGHIVAGFYSIILLAIAGLGLFLTRESLAIGWVSPFSLVIVLVYFIAMRSIFRYEQKNRAPEATYGAKAEGHQPELRHSLRVYAFNACIVIAAAMFLPFLSERIAQGFGLKESFFGTSFLAASTSLPELVISFTAVRLRSYDLVVGNLLGSNVFNMLILAIDDILYVKSSLFYTIAPDHLLSAFAVVVMTAVVGLGIIVRPRGKIWRLGIDSAIIFLIYTGLVAYLALT